jgi:uncharacterized membrane protein YhaH (DUF805 family)
MLRLFLSPSGRIGRAAYGLGLLAVVVLGGASLLLPQPWILASLLFAWPKLCLHIKRLHDIGRPSSALITPIVGNIFAAIVAAGIFFAAITSGGLISVRSRADPTAQHAAVALIVLAAVWTLGNLAWVAWLGFRRGDAGANMFGQPPARA